jgi:putative bacteriocin precursor
MIRVQILTPVRMLIIRKEIFKMKKLRKQRRHLEHTVEGFANCMCYCGCSCSCSCFILFFNANSRSDDTLDSVYTSTSNATGYANMN